MVVDSGSTDGSVATARARGALVHTIPAEQFHHGTTRNLAASLARGEVIVWTTQDAYPEDDRWLDQLTAPLRRGDASIAGVYGRQIAHHDASPPELYFLDFLYGPNPRTQRAASAVELTMETTLFSNANSAMPRVLLERFPFADDILIAEDQDWSRRVLLDGYALVYEPRAAVRHSHPYTLLTGFKRFFESGVAGDRTFLAGGREARGALRRRAVDYARGELGWLLRNGYARWIPYACVYELAKFAGLQLGVRHEHLPVWLKRRCTSYPNWFTGGSGATQAPTA